MTFAGAFKPERNIHGRINALRSDCLARSPDADRFWAQLSIK
jgi:hypothetical protein